ncbi:hypothetical protein AZF37_03760 [endosymbiont 'TC1' of Trimyema compressum]|uniref:DHH family phosphoesterase n=1 Tax=endosymbiont 'TC1' of Trimyema compressum TaxID=243899 RepID=UPI0007F14540|nr:bifunctional oligoribonuclease/PAP phosphatase NrnA [endosymbiont 'TC1' of Trimyema compressum]AMP20402.1 hypothetical protein AZF37_03760 [endosymbiont 'TC1' of Trimyema compressum]
MNKLVKALKNIADKRVCVTGHEAPDGDCIGSSLAMGYLMKQLGIETLVVNNDTIPSKYAFLQNNIVVQKLSSLTDVEKESIEVLIVLDSANEMRLGFNYREIFKNLEAVFNIDHHISNNKFGDINYVKPVGATAEIVTRIYLACQQIIDVEPATALYAGIMTDTGNLTYESTSYRTVNLVSRLYKMGAQTNLVRRNIYENESINKLEALKIVLNNLNVSKSGEIAYTFLSKKDIDSLQLISGDAEGYVDYPRKLDTCEVALFLKEFEEDVVKVSVRTKEKIDANKLASSFGGGGHFRAAGFRKKGPILEVAESIVAKIELGLNQNEWVD